MRRRFACSCIDYAIGALRGETGIKESPDIADMLIMRERRTEVRMMCADMLDICWKDGSSRKRQALALLEDISPSGACLQMEAPLPLGTEVVWKCGKQEFSGHVRYCAYREIGYFVGVEFDFRSRWSKKSYHPQHLLDLRSLAQSAK